jgi:hypothetical protein
MVPMFWRLMKSTFFLFLLPVVISLALFAFLNPGCQKDERIVSGELKILYSTDVGGAIDPCG